MIDHTQQVSNTRSHFNLTAHGPVGKLITKFAFAMPSRAIMRRIFARHHWPATRWRFQATRPTKTRASERRIALPARCLQSLKLHHEQQQYEREAAGTRWQDKGHVFTTPQGRPIDPTNLARSFTTLLRKAGLRRIRFHDLRHSTATLLLEQGVELVVIKELLGHTHIGVTATVYAHVRLRLQRDAIDLLGRALQRSDETTSQPYDRDEPPLRAAPIR
ncbi:Phage integrase family protein [Streptomyces sp. MnatMP-M17]|nr:Phage integrase family protein [Streptomyces sp. MnatMP-M17]